jgi:hypothetical protein
MEASGLRARFWCLVEEEFGSEEKRKRSAERWKESTRRKRKRRSGTVVEDGEEAAPLGERDETGNVGEGSKSGKWTRRQLFPHMGRTAMDIVGEGVDLRLEWRVGFDWTGEAESHISASARMPKSWQEEDKRGSLTKVPEMFDNLVKERGPLAAVRAIVGLLMPPS